MLNAIESDPHVDEATVTAQCALRDALDAYVAPDIDLEPLVPGAVLHWYQAASGESLGTDDI